MAREISTSCAEVVPDAPHSLTAAQLQTQPDDNWIYAVIDGRLSRTPSSGGKPSSSAAYLISLLVGFARPRTLGRVSGADGEYNLTLPGAPAETVLIPDVAFVRAERLSPLNSQEANAIPPHTPDLVAEIASPTQYRPELAATARRYLEAGVQLVWIVWSEQQQRDVRRPGSDRPMATLSPPDSLDGLDLLLSFRHPVADV